jgi:hypothetical protein
VIAYRATLDLPRELARFVAKLLAAERRRRGTPRGSRALSCFWQAVLGLRWFRDRTSPGANAPGGAALRVRHRPGGVSPARLPRSARRRDRGEPPLQERELIKPASLAAALVSRGVHERTAQLVVDMGMSVLRMASEGWIIDDRRPFAEHVRRAADELRVIAGQVTSDGTAFS